MTASITPTILLLEACKSDDERLSILNREREDEYLRYVFLLMTNKKIDFRLSHYDFDAKLTRNRDLDVDFVKQGLAILNDRMLGNTDDRLVDWFLCSASITDVLVFKMVAQQKLPIGITTTLLNKVWEDLVPNEQPDNHTRDA